MDQTTRLKRVKLTFFFHFFRKTGIFCSSRWHYCITVRLLGYHSICRYYIIGFIMTAVALDLYFWQYRPLPLCRLRVSRYYHLFQSDFSFPTFFFSIFLCISTPSMSKTVNRKQQVSRGDFSCPRRIFYYICYCLCRSKIRHSHVHVLAEVRTTIKIN